MDGLEAKAIATVLYHGRVDWSSLPEIGHMERVAYSVPPDCEVVAWLHDAVEDGLTTFGALKEAGITDVEYSALFLLTRMPEEGYLDYIRAIRAADGQAGEIARIVKLADNRDNMNRPCPADKLGARAPGGRYDKAYKILTGAHA